MTGERGRGLTLVILASQRPPLTADLLGRERRSRLVIADHMGQLPELIVNLKSQTVRGRER
jgi:hypothetical protein